MPSNGIRKWAKEKAQDLLNEAQDRVSESDAVMKVKSFFNDDTSTTRPLTTITNTRTSTTSASATPSVPSEPTFDGCAWNVPAAGKFKFEKEYIFENGIPEGLQASRYIVEGSYKGAPYDYRFESKNVYTDHLGFLNLKVPGVQYAQPWSGQTISSAEVTTSFNNILHASVWTKAIFSTVPGTCHGERFQATTCAIDRANLLTAGIFFYKNDQQETDIEYLTDRESLGNNINTTTRDYSNPIPIWYSNQAVTQGAKATQEIGPPPWDVTAVHEYRIDWTKQFTAFYLDGNLQKRYTTNIPTVPGYWIWNNWANGDKAWSSGPPKEDNIFKILSITMYYNTAEENADGC
ncbi:hypothetical protein LTR05_003983 [Lithohypha guttulata]|uniref:GH16 domain-containing protein n=1 Tax=Lithohypha guttulata TaxID=1690604 RepID=A0AAN7Y7D9_9EURO|nr:hypothetical protein LTR05_003983 [Lithohypha guttulata]